jgi:hypothetical protein
MPPSVGMRWASTAPSLGRSLEPMPRVGLSSGPVDNSIGEFLSQAKCGVYQPSRWGLPAVELFADNEVSMAYEGYPVGFSSPSY